MATAGRVVYRVGAKLLKGEWEAAVRMLMTGHTGDSPAVAAARKLFLEGGECSNATNAGGTCRSRLCVTAIFTPQPHPFRCWTLKTVLKAAGHHRSVEPPSTMHLFQVCSDVFQLLV